MVFAIIFLVLIPVAVVAIEVGTVRSVFGPFLSNAELGEFLDHYLEKYELNPFNKSGKLLCPRSYPSDLPYLAVHNSIFSKWYVEDRGVIPRWSPYSKLLDETRAMHIERYGYPTGKYSSTFSTYE